MAFPPRVLIIDAGEGNWISGGIKAQRAQRQIDATSGKFEKWRCAFCSEVPPRMFFSCSPFCFYPRRHRLFFSPSGGDEIPDGVAVLPSCGRPFCGEASSRSKRKPPFSDPPGSGALNDDGGAAENTKNRTKEGEKKGAGKINNADEKARVWGGGMERGAVGNHRDTRAPEICATPALPRSGEARNPQRLEWGAYTFRPSSKIKVGDNSGGRIAAAM